MLIAQNIIIIMQSETKSRISWKSTANVEMPLLTENEFFKELADRFRSATLKVMFDGFQVLLPLVDQYFTNHRLYFLSSPLKPLSSSGYASHKEKEMVAR